MFNHERKIGPYEKKNMKKDKINNNEQMTIEK